MESSKTDDSLKRWADTSESEKHVWNYFNDVIAKRIVLDAFNEKGIKKGITLASFYQRLAIARAQCEWIKSYVRENKIVNPSHEMIDQIAINNIYLSYPKGFPDFQFGGSEEKNLGGWGDTVTEFSKKRMKFRSVWYGLSTTLNVMGVTDLTHPKGSVLDKLESDFQQLCKTTDFFEYLKIASRLMFALSNFPPITRGSSSVNTWMIDFIAQHNFNLSGSLRPTLHDWTAYFETPEQYTSFYVISASFQFIKSLNKIKGLDEFERKLIVLMKENPNIDDILQQRENLWSELKLIINSELKSNTELTDLETKPLIEIASGNLIFRKPSERILKIIDILQQKNDVITNIELLSSEDREYLKGVLELKYNGGKYFLSCYGTENEEKNNLLWPDCEALNQLRSLILSTIMSHFGIMPDPDMEETPAITEEEKELADKMENIRDNLICLWGFIPPENFNQFRTLLELTTNIEQQVALALMNGMDLDELNKYVISKTDITSRDIEILTSRAAILLYKLKDNLSINDLVSVTPEETEKNILKLIASKYCHEDLKSIEDAKVRNCLLLYLDPSLFKYKKMSELVAGTAEETKKNILSVYLEKYNLTSLPIKVTKDNITEFLDTFIKYDPLKSHLKNLEYQLLRIEKMELEPRVKDISIFNVPQINTEPSTKPEQQPPTHKKT